MQVRSQLFSLHVWARVSIRAGFQCQDFTWTAHPEHPELFSLNQNGPTNLISIYMV